MAAQTRPPDEWVVVDDGSDDGTGELLGALAGRGPLHAGRCRRRRHRADEVDRLALAAAPRAFNVGLAPRDRDDFTHVAKLDGDVELPPRLLRGAARPLRRATPRLGIACGDLIEPDGGGWGV